MILGINGILASMAYIHPFNYDLHLSSIPSSNVKYDLEAIICFHGYGGDYRLTEEIRQQVEFDKLLVGFNFPDYGIQEGTYDPEKAAFGSIRELLPAIYTLKEYAVAKGIKRIDLYGRSAGGGALINTLAVLNTAFYDVDLKKIGITIQDKTTILRAIQNGVILLDVPLKSVEEIIDLRGTTRELEILAAAYKMHDMRPIDSIRHLTGLPLNILLYFEEGDEVLSNRDDELYIQLLKKANSLGTTKVIFGNSGGHSIYHADLWDAYVAKTPRKDH